MHPAVPDVLFLERHDERVVEVAQLAHANDALPRFIGFKPLFFLAYLLELVPVPPSWFWVFSPLVASSPEVEVGLGFCQLEPFTEVLDLRRTRLTNKVKFYFQKFSYAICFLQEVSSFLICPYITQWIVSSFQQTTYKTDKTVGSQRPVFFKKSVCITPLPDYF